MPANNNLKTSHSVRVKRGLAKAAAALLAFKGEDDVDMRLLWDICETFHLGAGGCPDNLIREKIAELEGKLKAQEQIKQGMWDAQGRQIEENKQLESTISALKAGLEKIVKYFEAMMGENEIPKNYVYDTAKLLLTLPVEEKCEHKWVLEEDYCTKCGVKRKKIYHTDPCTWKDCPICEPKPRQEEKEKEKEL